MPIYFLKWVLFSLVAVSFLFATCEKDDPISGDSKLKVINECGVSIKIYFDGTKLGSVNSDDTETWSVLSGTHTIKGTCSLSKDYEASHKFYTGKITTIRLELNKNDKSTLIKSTIIIEYE